MGVSAGPEGLLLRLLRRHHRQTLSHALPFLYPQAELADDTHLQFTHSGCSLSFSNSIHNFTQPLPDAVSVLQSHLYL